MTIETKLDDILKSYKSSFIDKVYSEENDDRDLLMNVFGITPQLKRENRQYWGRELGKCWESLVVEVCKPVESFQPALRIGGDEPCDLIVKQYAIDTKYRVGSGDSGTLKKFKSYGLLLRERGFEPVFLFLREDNLPAAMTACQKGTWSIYVGKQSFDFIKEISGFDIEAFLIRKANTFPVDR
ncbi:MAG: hypothetical protein NTW85_08135 [Methylococcales bacterium]|nr:hypothetical protein [Methylococcales bacterium]